MIGSIVRRLRKSKAKRVFTEFGAKIRSFQLAEYGHIDYAQWLHPCVTDQHITNDMLCALGEFISEGDTVIDVGAHCGDTTVPMAIVAGASGCTLALEPNPYVFATLALNASLNPGKTNIIPLNFAATETDGTLIFHYSDASYCNGGYLSQIQDQKHGHRYPLKVQGRNLERFLRQEYRDRLERLSYIKIDTEGFDRYVIRSISGILRDYRPVLVTEVLRRLVQQERGDLFDVLEDAGYQCFKQVDTLNARRERVRRQDMMRWRQFDILGIPKERA